MVLTSTNSSSSTSSQTKSSLARKIKIRQQIADSGRSSVVGGGNRAGSITSSRIMASEQIQSSSSSSSRLLMQQQQQQQQQQQPKVRKIAVEASNSNNGGGASVKQSQRSPRNSILQSSSASAAAQSVTRQAASPVLSQSGRRQLVISRDRHSPEQQQQQQLRPICKSASLPDNLEPAATKLASAQISNSILKQQQRSSSSSLLASLETARGWRSLLQLRRQRRNKPETESLQRKCVSFSEDTIERQEEERQRPTGPLKKHQALHEVKLYRKGVLQDRSLRDEVTGRKLSNSSNNLPLSWEESLGGPRALLGAAHDADDELVQKIINLANKVGLGNIQLNAQDNSGRTAISYLAGNGSALVLEACLSLAGADANLPDNEGNTPLHFAAQAGQTECLNILLQRCPNIEVDARNNLGFTPLMKAGLQGRTKCAKILLFAGANPTLRDHGRGLRAEQWARFCGRYVCAEVIERFARHRLLEKTTSCRWGSEPELAAQVLQGKLMPVPSIPVQPPPASGLKSKIRRVFRTTSNSDKTSFSLVSQLTSAALCASSPVLPKPGDVSPVVKSLLRPLSVPQLRITLVAPHQELVERTSEKCSHSTTAFSEKIESTMVKPPRTKKKSK